MNNSLKNIRSMISIFYQSPLVKWLITFSGLSIILMMIYTYPFTPVSGPVYQTEEEFNMISDVTKVKHLYKPSNYQLQEYYDDYLDDGSIGELMNVENFDDVLERNRLLKEVYEDALAKLEKGIKTEDPKQILRDNIYFQKINILFLFWGLDRIAVPENIYSQFIDYNHLVIQNYAKTNQVGEAYLDDKYSYGNVLEWILLKQVHQNYIFSFWGIVILLSSLAMVVIQHKFNISHYSLLAHNPIKNSLKSIVMNASNIFFLYISFLLIYTVGTVIGFLYQVYINNESLTDNILYAWSNANLQVLYPLVIGLVSIMFIYSLSKLILNITRQSATTAFIVITLYSLPYLLVLTQENFLLFNQWNPFLYIDIEKNIGNFRDFIFDLKANLYFVEDHFAIFYLLGLTLIISGTDYLYTKHRTHRITI